MIRVTKTFGLTAMGEFLRVAWQGDPGDSTAPGGEVKAPGGARRLLPREGIAVKTLLFAATVGYRTSFPYVLLLAATLVLYFIRYRRRMRIVAPEDEARPFKTLAQIQAEKAAGPVLLRDPDVQEQRHRPHQPGYTIPLAPKFPPARGKKDGPSLP
jgi:hypothetical protein